MSAIASEPDRGERMAEAVRQIVSSRERAPRSPRMERALKRLIWRYSQPAQKQDAEMERDSVPDMEEQ